MHRLFRWNLVYGDAYTDLLWEKNTIYSLKSTAEVALRRDRAVAPPVPCVVKSTELEVSSSKLELVRNTWIISAVKLLDFSITVLLIFQSGRTRVDETQAAQQGPRTTHALRRWIADQPIDLFSWYLINLPMLACYC